MRMAHGIIVDPQRVLTFVCSHDECVQAHFKTNTLSDYRNHLAVRHQVADIASQTSLTFTTFEGKYS